MGDVDNVRVAANGAASVGPSGSTLPTSAEATLDTALKDLGLISVDGMTEAFNQDTNDIPDWSGAVVRTTRQNFKPTFGLTFLEHNKQTIHLYFGVAPTTIGGTGSKVEVGPFQSDKRVLVIDTFDGARIARYVLPNAEVTERGERQHKNDSAAGFPVTVTAYPDDNGKTHYIYYDEDYSS